jgi:hypothetical protein
MELLLLFPAAILHDVAVADDKLPAGMRFVLELVVVVVVVVVIDWQFDDADKVNEQVVVFVFGATAAPRRS